MHDEDFSDDNEPEYLEGVFNAHLLEDEVMDQNSYKGSMTDESNQSSEKRFDNSKDQLDIESDIKKHLNVDFGEDENPERNRLSIGDEKYADGLASELDGFNNEGYYQQQNSSYYD